MILRRELADIHDDRSTRDRTPGALNLNLANWSE
jgi:hypothetical protein